MFLSLKSCIRRQMLSWEYFPTSLHPGVTMWLGGEWRCAFFPVSHQPLTGLQYRTYKSQGNTEPRGARILVSGSQPRRELPADKEHLYQNPLMLDPRSTSRLPISHTASSTLILTPRYLVLKESLRVLEIFLIS